MEHRKHLAGRKIRTWRERNALTATELGERMFPADPVPPHTIYGWEERGKLARSHRIRQRLADMGICEFGDWLEPAQQAA